MQPAEPTEWITVWLPAVGLHRVACPSAVEGVQPVPLPHRVGDWALVVEDSFLFSFCVFGVLLASVPWSHLEPQYLYMFFLFVL